MFIKVSSLFIKAMASDYLPICYSDRVCLLKRGCVCIKAMVTVY